MMTKIIGALAMIFAKPLVTALLPQLIKAEKTKQPGPVKKQIATQTIIVIINQNPEQFTSADLNPSVPWPELIPILIDAMIRVLNLFFGKKWGDHLNPDLLASPEEKKSPS